jgi:hypothetical protein
MVRNTMFLKSWAISLLADRAVGFLKGNVCCEDSEHGVLPLLFKFKFRKTRGRLD